MLKNFIMLHPYTKNRFLKNKIRLYNMSSFFRQTPSLKYNRYIGRTEVKKLWKGDSFHAKAYFLFMLSFIIVLLWSEMLLMAFPLCFERNVKMAIHLRTNMLQCFTLDVSSDTFFKQGIFSIKRPIF